MKVLFYSNQTQTHQWKDHKGGLVGAAIRRIFTYNQTHLHQWRNHENNFFRSAMKRIFSYNQTHPHKWMIHERSTPLSPPVHRHEHAQLRNEGEVTSWVWFIYISILIIISLVIIFNHSGLTPFKNVLGKIWDGIKGVGGKIERWITGEREPPTDAFWEVEILQTEVDWKYRVEQRWNGTGWNGVRRLEGVVVHKIGEMDKDGFRREEVY